MTIFESITSISDIKVHSMISNEYPVIENGVVNGDSFSIDNVSYCGSKYVGRGLSFIKSVYKKKK